jgi:3-hydroxyisobutyrate dehydrogenase
VRAFRAASHPHDTCVAPAVALRQNVPSSRDYAGGFGSALMLKDLGLAADAAKAVGAPLAVGGAAQALYSLMCNLGYSKKDFSSVFQMLAQREAK